VYKRQIYIFIRRMPHVIIMINPPHKGAPGRPHGGLPRVGLSQEGNSALQGRGQRRLLPHLRRTGACVRLLFWIYINICIHISPPFLSDRCVRLSFIFMYISYIYIGFGLGRLDNGVVCVLCFWGFGLPARFDGGACKCFPFCTLVFCFSPKA